MGMAVLMDTAGCRSNAVLRRKPAFRLSTSVGPGTCDMEAALKCRSGRTPQYSPPVDIIKLTEKRVDRRNSLKLVSIVDDFAAES